jgi:hypothetical protein
MTLECGHLATINIVTPSTRGCEDCLKTGDSWLPLGSGLIARIAL